jgi:hypothetical protein
MANLVSKIEFPRNSPDGLIALGKTILKKHKENPEKILVPPVIIEKMSKAINNAEAMRQEAKELATKSVQLNAAADKLLGVSIGQTLTDTETLTGNIADFRDYAYLSCKDNVEQLKEYGFGVKISQKTGRISEERSEVIRNSPAKPAKEKKKSKA